MPQHRHNERHFAQKYYLAEIDLVLLYVNRIKSNTENNFIVRALRF